MTFLFLENHLLKKNLSRHKSPSLGIAWAGLRAQVHSSWFRDGDSHSHLNLQAEALPLCGLPCSTWNAHLPRPRQALSDFKWLRHHLLQEARSPSPTRVSHGPKAARSPQVQAPSPSQFYPGMRCRLRCSNSVTGSSSVRTGSLHLRTGPAACSAWLCRWGMPAGGTQPRRRGSSDAKAGTLCLGTHRSIYLSSEHPPRADAGEQGQAWSLHHWTHCTASSLKAQP